MIYNCRNCQKDFKFKGISYRNVYCNDLCHREFKHNESLKLFEEQFRQWLDGEDLGLKNPRALIKKFVERRDGYKCNRCGLTEWLGERITLWCDHIDGDATNNKPNNFRLICPNCDSQSETFGAKNYGKGRKARGLPQYG
jgi:hypothetical protein